MGVKAGPAGASAADSRRRPGAPVPEDLLHQAHAVMQSSACRIAYPRLAGLRAATTHSIPPYPPSPWWSFSNKWLEQLGGRRAGAKALAHVTSPRAFFGSRADKPAHTWRDQIGFTLRSIPRAGANHYFATRRLDLNDLLLCQRPPARTQPHADCNGGMHVHAQLKTAGRARAGPCTPVPPALAPGSAAH